MNHQVDALSGALLAGSAAVILSIAAVGGQSRPAGGVAPAAQAKTYQAARTPWGHPDLSGVYT
jgi:hypothetical protein